MNHLMKARADVLLDGEYEEKSSVCCILIFIRLSSQGKKAVIRMLGMLI